MAIYKRGGTWYIHIVHRGQRIRRSARTEDREEAQRQHDELKARLWRQRLLTGHTWRDAVAAWMKAAPRDNADRYRLRSLAYPDRPIEEITSASLDSAISDKHGATRNRYITMITAILNHARRSGWIERVPRLARHKTAPARVRWLTGEEWTRLDRELPDHLRPLARFALATGLRQRNVTHLEWSRVDLHRRTLWIAADQTKSRRAIGISLSDDAIEVLTTQIGQHQRWVFPWRGKPIQKIKTAWRAALLRAGIHDFRWHDLRHTWASWHIMNGTPVEVLRELGGWRTLQMVLRYAHLAPEHLARYAGNSRPVATNTDSGVQIRVQAVNKA